VIKVVTLLHRNPELSASEFRDYYETHHRLIGEKYLAPYAARYLRRYPMSASSESLPEFDVMMEVWFESEAQVAAAQAGMATDEAKAEIEADEQKLFDRSRSKTFTVLDCESDLTF